MRRLHDDYNCCGTHPGIDGADGQRANPAGGSCGCSWGRAERHPNRDTGGMSGMGCSLPSRKGLGMRSPRLLVPLVLMDAFSRTTAIIVVEAAHRLPLFGAERCNADVGEEISSLSGQLPPVFSQYHSKFVSQCRRWVISGHYGANLQCLLYSQKQTSDPCSSMSALCQYRT